MKKTVQILTFLSLLTTQVYAQTASWLWAKNLPYDKSANQGFVKSTVDKNGNTYMITRLTSGSAIYPNGTISGQEVYILSKTNLNGAILWGKKLPFTLTDSEINTLEINGRNEIYFTYIHRKSCFGVTPDKCFTMMDGFSVIGGTNLVKADSNGAIKYVKPLVIRTLGGYRAFVSQLVLKGDSQLVVIGNGSDVSESNKINMAGVLPSGTINSFPYNTTYFIGMIDSSAKGISAKYITTNNADIPNSINSAVVDNNGNLYLAGRINRQRFNGNFSIDNFPFVVKDDYYSFVAKINASYQFEWVKYVRGKKVNNELRTFNINKLALDLSGNNLYLIGNGLDSVKYDGNTFLTMPVNLFNLNAFLASINTSDGNLNWKKSYSTTLQEDILDVDVDNSDNVVVLQNKNIFRYSKSGEQDVSFVGSGNLTDIYLLGNNRVLCTGSFIKVVTVGTFQLGSNTNTNITIPMIAMGQFATTITSSSETYENETIKYIYPNPTTDKLYINSNSDTYTIFNSLGAEIEKSTISGNSINVSQLDNGVYHLELSNNGVSQRMKFIKQ